MEYIKTKAEFEKLINENQNVVIDFFAEWCGPCKMLGPVIENVANIQNKAKIVKVNVDEADDYQQCLEFVQFLQLFILKIKN
mgnify:CR=1 FL=1